MDLTEHQKNNVNENSITKKEMLTYKKVFIPLSFYQDGVAMM